MTRTVNGEFLLDEVAREVLRKQIWQVARFSGVEVMTYCILSNHFHVLVRVPDAEGVSISDAEILQRFKLLYPNPTKYQALRYEIAEDQLRRKTEEGQAFRKQMLARMHNVSEFMKTLKQRFSIWYNKNHNRYGTLWSERFKSVLVEGRGSPLWTMALYIDLNPVRARIVEDPKDYRFCGYGEAMGGHELARKGIYAVRKRVYGGDKLDVEASLEDYRQGLLAKGVLQAHGKGELSGVMDREKMLKVAQKGGGRLPLAVALHLRVRYFTDGAILGSRAFILEHSRARKGIKRKMKPNRVPIVLDGNDDLFIDHNLRGSAFGD